MSQTLKHQIKELEERIEEWGAKYGPDVATSYNESTQATLTLEVYQKQLAELKDRLEESENSLLKKDLKITLNNDSEELVFTITSGEIDPRNLIISLSSPIGEKLSKMRVGDSFKFRDSDFIITNIQ